jgi:hypothetical protein
MLKTICFTVAALLLTVPALADSTVEKNRHSFSKGLFIGVATGPSKIDIDQKNYDGDLQLSSSLDSYGLDIAIEAGYRFSKHFFATVSYQYLPTDDADIQHIFVSGNIQFSTASHIRPFIGFTAGVSRMRWDRNFNAIHSENESDSGLYGPQVGLEILTGGPISLHCTYQYLFTDMKTELYLIPDVSKLTYENFQNLLIGIRYNF